MTTFIYPYKAGSVSAKSLATALNCKRAKREGPLLRCETFINWGSSVVGRNLQLFGKMNYLNYPEAIVKASNKLESFKAFQGVVPTPMWTTSQDEASRWLMEGVCEMVVCRTKLNGHSGEGIVLSTKVEELVPAPLYTVYLNKNQEYRVHVFQGEVFFIQRKARKLDVPDEKVNWKIRNHKNGFIYANKDVEVDKAAKQCAVDAVQALGLDFGAVDLLMDYNGDFYVLEVNTACGLEGTTLEKYVEQFKKVM